MVGIGGGSVLNVAKLLSVLCHPQSPGLDALLAGEKPTQRVQSWLIPTTAGTGSEATPNAILAIPEQSTKVGIISQVLLPDYVALFPGRPPVCPRILRRPRALMLFATYWVFYRDRGKSGQR